MIEDIIKRLWKSRRETEATGRLGWVYVEDEILQQLLAAASSNPNTHIGRLDAPAGRFGELESALLMIDKCLMDYSGAMGAISGPDQTLETWDALVKAIEDGAALASPRPASQPKFQVGQTVYWRGQIGECSGIVLEITRPENSGYVLKLDIGDGAEMFHSEAGVAARPASEEKPA